MLQLIDLVTNQFRFFDFRGEKKNFYCASFRKFELKYAALSM